MKRSNSATKICMFWLAITVLLPATGKTESPVQIEMADDAMFQRLAGKPKDSAAKGEMRFAKLPAGLHLPIKLTTNMKAVPLSSGSIIEGRTARTVRLPDNFILPAGTKLSGTIKTVRSSANEPAIVQLAFDTMTLRSGTRFPIASRVPPLSSKDLTLKKELPVRMINTAQVAVAGSVL